MTRMNFTHWFTPPTFADDEKSRLAGQQNTIVWGTITIAFIFGLLTLVFQPEPWPRLLLTGLWLPMALGSLILLHRGNINMAGLLYATFAWLILTLDAWLSGGVMSAGFSSYTIIIMVIGILTGLRVALLFAGFSFAMGGVLLYAGNNDLLPLTPLVTTPQSLWLALTANFVAAAVLVNLATSSFSNAFKQAQAKKAVQDVLEERTGELAKAVEQLEIQLTERQQILEALARSEQELRRLNLELEQRVRERTSALAETNEALTQEIATRQQAELALYETVKLIERAKQEWEVTVDATPQFIGLVDREGRLMRANRTVERWNLAPVTKVKGQTIHQLFHPHCTNPVCPIETNWRQASQKLHQGQAWQGEAKDEILGRYLQWQVEPISAVVPERQQASDTYGVVVVQDITERKQMEDALRESQQRLELAISGTGGALWDETLDPEATFEGLNGAVYLSLEEKRLLGYSETEANELPGNMFVWDRHVLPEDQAQRQQNQRDHFEGRTEVLDHEYRVRRTDGAIRWIQGRSRIIRDELGRPIRWIGIDWDVTQRRQAEEQLRKLSSAIQQSPSTVMITDVEGRIEFVNPRFNEVTGYDRAEVVGQNPRLSKSGQHPPEFYQELWQTILAGQVWRGELINRSKAGNLYWELASIAPIKDPAGRITHFVKVSEDITEHKQVELELARYRDHLEELVNERTAQLNQTYRKLQQSEENFKALANNAQDGFAVISGAEQIVYVNPRCGQLVGYSIEELLNCTVKDLLPPAEYPTISRRYRRRLAGQTVINQYQTALRHKRGQLVPVDLTAARTTWYGQPAIVASFRDITARKQAEAELQQRHQELQALQRASATISSSLELTDVLEKVTREMADLLQVESCHFSRWDHHHNTLHGLARYAPAGWQGDDPEPAVYYLADYPLTHHVLVTGQPAQLTSSQPDIDPAERAYMERGRIKTLLMLPLIYQDQTMGLVELEDSRVERTFSEHDIQLAQTFTDQAAVAIQNARLYEQARQEIAERERVQVELEHSEAQFRQVITSISDHIYVTEITAAGEHLNRYISPNIEIITGYPPGKFLADWSFWSEYVIYPADRASAATQSMRFEQGQSGETEYRLTRADGRVIWVRDSGRVELNNGSKIVYGVVNDITARKAAEETILRYSERLEILRDIEQGILSAQSVEAIGRVVVTRIRRIIPCSRVSIRIFNETATEMMLVTGYDEAAGLLNGGDSIKIDQFTVSPQWAKSLQQGQIMIVGEQELNQLDVGRSQLRRVSLMIVPLIYQAELIGTLNLSTSTAGVFSSEQQEVAQQVANQLAIAISQTQLYEQVQCHAEELELRVIDRTRELSALYEVTAVASQTLELPVMLNQALEQVLAALRSDVGLIWLFEDEVESQFRLAAQQGLGGDELDRVETEIKERGLLSQVVGQNQPLLLAAPSLAGPTFSANLQIFAGAAIRAGGQPLGVLAIFGSLENQFNLEDVALLSSVADQIGVAVENTRLREQVRQAAVLAERERLARELHDSVTQSLYSLGLFAASALEESRSGHLEPVQHYLTRIGETNQQALKEMRLMIYELRPVDLERLGLVGALHRRLAAVEQRAGITARLIAEDLIELPLPVEQELYWITQEALNNALKHAQATEVVVYLRRLAAEVELTILDNGQGFNLDEVETKGGLGLRGIRERVEVIKGSLTIRSTPGKGTIIEVRV